jgi:hypothetical protein
MTPVHAVAWEVLAVALVMGALLSVGAPFAVVRDIATRRVADQNPSGDGQEERSSDTSPGKTLLAAENRE